MKQLIVNADDLGLHENINMGILAGHVNGCITSTSLMAGGGAFEHAVYLAKANPQLGIGVHLTLVGCRPVSKPEEVPTLVDSNGLLPEKYPIFLRQFILGKVSLKDIHREFRAQVKKVLEAGLTITHLDSHQHMHVVPGIIDIAIEVANEFNIKAMRIPDESLLFIGGSKATAGRLIGRTGLSVLASVARRKAMKKGLVTPRNFFGMLAGGGVTESLLLNVIRQLPAGNSEIMVHPGNDNILLNDCFGWNYTWQQELAAVTSSRVLEALAQKKINLISFRALSK